MAHLLTVSGSLRAGSPNATLVAAAARVAPTGVVVRPYSALAALPAFNPDVEEGDGPIPSEVEHWRAALTWADAVLFSSPEYAHGIPGAFKNALDWVVGSGELVDKRVGLLSASAASQFAHPQIVEVLRTMNAAVVPESTIVIDLPRRGVDVERLVNDPAVATSLRAAVAALFAGRSLLHASSLEVDEADRILHRHVDDSRPEAGDGTERR
jgi:chromate reductase, NAD(P)H dehydrogenase (quinone)